ncbi:MAG: hypothetical protein ACR2NL_11560, partial [Acidimicrobiia bacterium]
GSDLRRFVADALAYYRGVFLAHYAPNLEEIVDESADRIERWRATARTMPAADVIQAIDQLSGALIQLREGREERLVVELSVIRLTRHDTAVDPVSLAARLDRIETRLRREGGVAPPAEQPAAVAPPVAEKKLAAPKPADAPFEEPPAVEPAPAAAAQPAPMKDEMPDADLSMQAVQSAWPALIGKVREAVGPRRYALLKEAAPGLAEENRLVLHVPAHLTFHLESLKEDQALRDVVEMAASDLLGGRVRVAYEPGPESGGGPGMQEKLPDSPPRAPAPGDLVGEAEGGIDPTKLVEDLLGGEVIEE